MFRFTRLRDIEVRRVLLDRLVAGARVQDVQIGTYATLIVVPFPRSIKMEGLRKIAMCTYEDYRKRGLAPLFLVPVQHDMPPGYEYVYVTDGASCGLVVLVRMMIAVVLLSKEVGSIHLLENSPATPIFAVLLRFVKYQGDTVIRFVTPLQPLARMMKVFMTKPRCQFVYHYLACNYLLAKFFRGFLPKDVTYLVASEHQKEQISSGRLNVVVKNPYLGKRIWIRGGKTSVDRRFVLGYLGHFSSVKGVDVLLRAYIKVCVANSNVCLKVAWSGKGDEAQRVLGLIERFQPKARIDLLGTVHPYEFLSSIDLLVLPYLIDSVPIPPAVLVESLQTGTPVLISDIEDISGEYSAYCRFFRAGSAKSLYKEVIKFINSGQ